jgi:D-alanyl-D-alanine carboxypeptidase (penicillin-binding protein 5/6)
MAVFLPGEKVKAIDLLYGAMLSSGADAAEALAICASDSQESFITLMNQKAKELKMDNTNFTNASGLHHINQNSTA